MLDVFSSGAVVKKRAKTDVERQVHPIGTLVTVDDGWRKKLVQALVDKDMSQRELARRVGVTAGTISNLALGRHDQARKTVIASIHAALGWEPLTDTAAVSDDAYRRIIDGALEISAEDRETVARLVESLKSRRT